MWDGEISIDAEDVQPICTLKTPKLPSREAVEEHRIDNDACFEGVGRAAGHSNVESNSIAMISLDFLLFTRRGVFSEDEAG